MDAQTKQNIKAEAVTLQRISPKSDESKEFLLDSLKIREMEKVIEEESKNDLRYFRCILVTENLSC